MIDAYFVERVVVTFGDAACSQVAVIDAELVGKLSFSRAIFIYGKFHSAHWLADPRKCHWSRKMVEQTKIPSHKKHIFKWANYKNIEVMHATATCQST